MLTASTVSFVGDCSRALGADRDPDLGLAVDGTPERAVPGVDDADRVTRLGGGVGIERKDATVVSTPSVVRRLTDAAAERDVAHQPEVASNVGTDTRALGTAAGATPVGALSVPVRYYHYRGRDRTRPRPARDGRPPDRGT